jgi:phosphatidylserine decarboxylase
MEEKYGDMPDDEFYDTIVYRDPTRKIVPNKDVFYSPADGIILYAIQLDSLDEEVEIKGLHYKALDLLGGYPLFQGPCLAIGIFLTDYDVHTLRLPTNGRLYYEELEPIDSHNKPLIFAEENLLHGRLDRAYKEIDKYLYHNARMLNRVVRDDGYSYYIVEIADSYDKVIAPFSIKQGAEYKQGDRFSLIRSGSQADLILPGDFSLSTKVLNYVHVEAGLSEVVFQK